jgi:hypothetical protein
MEFKTSKPTQTAMYLVDRGMQGKYYRWYDAETDTWSMCGSDMTEALSFVGKPSPVGFFPWVGPMTGPRFDPNTGVAKVEEKSPKVAKVKPAARKMARQRTAAPAKLVITTVGNTRVGSIVKGTKTTHPDGTVFFREDRQKWVCVIDGKQPAARPTKEAVINFLKKKYPNIQPVIID